VNVSITCQLGRHHHPGVGADMAFFMASNNKNFADPAVLHADLDLLLDIVVLLCAAALGGMLATVVKMPPIIGYILGGVVVGPSGCALIGAVVQVCMHVYRWCERAKFSFCCEIGKETNNRKLSRPWMTRCLVVCILLQGIVPRLVKTMSFNWCSAPTVPWSKLFAESNCFEGSQKILRS
jgi:hypothetical protein